MTAPKNPRLTLPVTIPGSEALANQERANALIQQRKRGQRPAFSGLVPATSLPFERAPDATPTAGERRQEALRASYLVSDTTPSRVDLSNTDVPGYIQLDVTEIDSYDKNPRLWRNEKFDEIYNSIKENGFTGSLTVTRRRVGDRYMLAAGSNTTLEIIKDLWAKTSDEKFRWVNCIFQPYESETRLLAQHLGENLNRGDMRFWEVARGACDLIAQIEADAQARDASAKPLSIREKAEALTARGIKAGRNLVQVWTFAQTRLQGLGSAASRLTFVHARDVLQPRLNALRALAEKFGVSEGDYWGAIVDPALERYAKSLESVADEELDAPALCDLVESAFAVRVNESLASVRQMLSILKLSPAMTLADLRMPSPSLIARSGGSGSTAAQEAADASPDPQGITPPAPADATGPAAGSGSQAPLPLPPGQVRGPGSSPPASGRPSTRPTNGPDTGGSPVAGATSAAEQPALFAGAEGDPLQALHAAVEGLLAEVGLSDTLRYHDQMPLGFFIELPDRERHARSRVQLYTPEHYARMAKSMVWWSLVYMTGQFREGAVPFMDHNSQFFHHFSSDDGSDPLAGTDVENQQPDPHELQIHRILPGALREAARQLRLVEELAAQALEKLPERLERLLQVYKSQA